jgi:ribosomal protein S26
VISFLANHEIKSYGYTQCCDANVPTRKSVSRFEMKFLNETSSISSDLDENGNITNTRVSDNCLCLKIKCEFSVSVTLSSIQNERLEQSKKERQAMRNASKAAILASSKVCLKFICSLFLIL